MLQNYEILFVVGTLGTIVSFCFLLVGMMRVSKALKIISGMLICTFVVMFSTGIALGYYNYENSKKMAKQNPQETPLTSGTTNDPIVITEKSFSEDDTYYYSEFEIKNNTNIEISKISFDVVLTDKFTPAELAHSEHLFLLDSVIPPKKTVIKNYIWKKYYNNKQQASSNAKLVKIQNLVSYVNINGQEQILKLADLKSLEK
jgi:hypothetical protein